MKMLRAMGLLYTSPSGQPASHPLVGASHDSTGYFHPLVARVHAAAAPLYSTKG